ncbi:MAG: hypothetical protein HC841_04360 [Verrucomicrobiae bacterium]|nr:hypothetical protein [Verrucomicrobiae bacterium]
MDGTKALLGEEHHKRGPVVDPFDSGLTSPTVVGGVLAAVSLEGLVHMTKDDLVLVLMARPNFPVNAPNATNYGFAEAHEVAYTIDLIHCKRSRSCLKKSVARRLDIRCVVSLSA